MWDPRGLPVRRQWFCDGPLVCVDFVRESLDHRMTLVLDAGAPPVRALWALMDTSNLERAREQLRKREGCSRIEDIGCWAANGVDPPQTILELPKWAESNGLDGAVWTALRPRFDGRDVRPEAAQVIKHLKSLHGAELENAERYVRRAPGQIDTPYRRLIEAELGWTNTDS